MNCFETPQQQHKTTNNKCRSTARKNIVFHNMNMKNSLFFHLIKKMSKVEKYT